ncbi:glycosyltransferase [Streptomyces sp. GC420]|uniref:glycosyltransferase n=1 Tax=Streptomyces sp. GC420 TaxID=2697568 RepID=UPI0014152358|nr:glycosyltransferase [Streptomyces sp. GC420]NBM15634.1 glycosyltransferase [Streptomyces sp. GC420]
MTESGGLTVLHLTQPADGGVGRIVEGLVRAQVMAGMRVAVACPSDGPLAPAAARHGARVHPWRAVRAPGPLLVKETAHVRELVRGLRPDVLHAHSAKAGLAGRLAVRGRIPTVFQPHAWSFEAVEGPVAAFARRWERHAARWSDRVICVSDAERRRGERSGIVARWAVVRNGIDLDHYRPGPADRARASLAPLRDLPPGTPLVLCVGRLCRQKGQDVLLRAWATVAPHVPDARLVLVGDGPDHGALRTAARPSVIFAGEAEDTAPWYRAADVVVLPSRWEGMALAPLEAMACGRPVVVTDTDGARESLPPGHETHCLVEREEPGALAAAVLRLLRDPALRDTLGREAQGHASAVYDVRHTADAVANLYRELLGGPQADCRERTSR